MPKIKILDAGFVTAIKMSSPIVNPIIVPTNTVGLILRENHRVIEYDDNGNSILLTLDNYRDPNRFVKHDAMESQKAKVVESVIGTTCGKPVSIDTSAPTFTGYTKNTAAVLEPPTAPAGTVPTEVPINAQPSSNKLTKSQRKALAKAKREEEAAAVKVISSDETNEAAPVEETPSDEGSNETEE